MKKLIVNVFSALLVFMTSISMVQSQQVYRFSVQQAVDYAKQNSVQVKNALLDYKIQEQVNKQVTASAYPHVNVSGGVTYNPNVTTQVLPNFISPATYQVLIDQGVKDGNGDPIKMPNDFGFISAQFGTKYNANAAIALNQLLFDGQVFVGLQARKTVLDFANMQTQVTEEMIKANVEKIYYQLVVGKQQISTLTANIDRISNLLKDTKAMFKQGFAEKLDIDKLNVQLSNLETEKSKAQSQLDAGNSGLKFLMHLPQKDTLILTDSITEDKIKENMLNSDYNYTDRKDFQLLEINKRLNEYDVKRYKMSSLPTLSLTGSYGKNAQRNKFNFFQSGSNYPWYTSSYIGLNLSYSLFDGFAKRASLNQAKLNLQKTENNIDLLKSSIDNDVTQARVQISNAILTMDNQKQNMLLAEDVYNTTKKKFEAGVGSNQEIYNAEADLKTAQNNYYSALYDAIIAKINYLQATGKL